MDHSCYKCGHSIEEGKPFCPQCGAPQIRVTVPETLQDPILADHEAVLPRDGETATVSDIPGRSLSTSSSRDIKPCAFAAAVALVLTFLGLNPFVAALGTGLLAVAFNRNRRGSAIRPATGARLGAISGLLLFGMSAVFEAFAVAVLHKGPEVRAEMMEKVQQTAARYPGPQVEPFLNFVKSPEGFAFMMAASIFFGLAAFIVLGSVGGAVAAKFLGRHRQP